MSFVIFQKESNFRDIKFISLADSKSLPTRRNRRFQSQSVPCIRAHRLTCPLTDDVLPEINDDDDDDDDNRENVNRCMETLIKKEE